MDQIQEKSVIRHRKERKILKIYLIDFENVKSKGLEGIDKLEETDSVIIFFSENSDTLSFEMHQKVLSSKADIEYFKVSVGGKNALDFQLSTLLGYMVAKEIYTHIFVISNDRGFDFLHAFWGGNYIDAPSTLVYRTRTIKGAIEYGDGLQTEQEPAEAEAEQPAQPQAQPEPEPQEEQIEQKAEKPEKPKKQAAKAKKKPAKAALSFDEMFTALLDGSCSKGSYDKVKSLFVSSETKEEFHNSLAKIYKQQGTDIYKAVKSKYLKLKEKYAEENPEASAPGFEQQEQTEIVIETVPEEVTQASDRLAELLSGLCEPDDIDRVRKCIDSTVNKREFYISMVKEFQRKKGCEYYNVLKPHYNELSGKVSES